MKLNYHIITSLLFLLLILFAPKATAQPEEMNKKYADSISKILPELPNDSVKVKHLIRLAGMYTIVNPEISLQYANEGAGIAAQIHYIQGEIASLGKAGFILALKGDWAKSTFNIYRAMQLSRGNDRTDLYLSNIMWINAATQEDRKGSLVWANRALHNPYFSTLSEVGRWATYMQLSNSYERLGMLDSAKYYAAILLDYTKRHHGFSPDLEANSYRVSGIIALQEKNYSAAMNYFQLAEDDLGKARVFQAINQQDSAVFYGERSLQFSYQQKTPFLIEASAKLLASLYASSNPEKSLKYLSIYSNSRDSTFAYDKLKALEFVKLNELKNRYEYEKNKTASRNNILLLSLLAVISIVSITGFLLWRNNLIKQKANKNLEKAYTDLKSTQSQLIQSEKMASLGELTAGIAHEIQNPLNFVNNFSEVNKELLVELKDEIKKGNLEEVNSIADDVISNEEKINHHGKRADAIVKGMLQHSRSSSGVKEPTDINALADEYLRLAYHGLRAKDKSFNANMKTDFDESIGNINIIPQDIGRVILNLITNAFYVVNERQKAESGMLNAEGKAYEPTVSVSTKKINGTVEIKVSDNGNGIPEHIKDKIFQPFFTTKPTGQGTGLGLSLSYDIVKAHGGELKVETKEGEGSEFIIKLPIS